MTKRVFHIMGTSVLLLFFILTLSTSVESSSFHGTGKLKELNPVDGRDKDRGHCLFFTGPHGDFLEEGQFLLFLIDDTHEDGFELELFGTFEMEGERKFKLFPDEEFAEGFIEGTLSDQLGNGNVDLDLSKLRASVVFPRDIGAEELINCRVSLRGDLMDGDGINHKVKLSYRGVGLHLADFHGEFQEDDASSEVVSSTVTAQQQGSCPFPNLTPDDGKFCEPNTCLLNFAGFQWWTLFHYDPAHGFYYNGGLQTIFAPQNASVDAEGLHLKIARRNLGGGEQWAGSEVVAVRNADGTPANLGFGTYLVSVKVLSAPSWSELDRNVAVGLFTYQKDKSGDENNPYRELDLAEISRWGNPPGTSINDCKLTPKFLCDGNAQFALQLWNKTKMDESKNVHRYTIADGVEEITLVMEWNAAKQPVMFKQYNGRFTLDNLPEDADNKFPTPSDRDDFIPDSDCQRFHMNFWMGNFGEAVNHLNPGPSNGQPQEVVITNFQYRPLN